MGANNEQHKQEENLQAEVDEREAGQEDQATQAESPESTTDGVDGVDEATEAPTEEASPNPDSNSSSAEQDELRRQLEEHQQRLLRIQADYDNFRRRTRLEKEDYVKYAASGVVEQLLPVLDNFDRALQSAQGTNDFESLFKGVDMIYRQFQQILEQSGLQVMDTIGQPFNPEYHEAVMKVEDTDQEEGTVVEELQKGYLFKDKVLRPAMVKVSG